jgi:ABC-type spermidine/putrescine transport system permease subunit I
MDTSGGESWPGQCRRPTVRPAVPLLPGYRTSPGITGSGSGRDLDHAGNLVRFLKRFFPPDLSVSGQILEALIETIQIAVLATFFSILLAFPLAVAGAQTLSPRWLVRSRE